jgi:hypothetical protein
MQERREARVVIGYVYCVVPETDGKHGTKLGMYIFSSSLCFPTVKYCYKICTVSYKLVLQLELGSIIAIWLIAVSAADEFILPNEIFHIHIHIHTHYHHLHVDHWSRHNSEVGRTQVVHSA